MELHRQLARQYGIDGRRPPSEQSLEPRRARSETKIRVARLFDRRQRDPGNTGAFLTADQASQHDGTSSRGRRWIVRRQHNWRVGPILIQAGGTRVDIFHYAVVISSAP